MDRSNENVAVLVTLQEIMFDSVSFLTFLLEILHQRKYRLSEVMHHELRAKYSLIAKIPRQIERLRDRISMSDVDCVTHMRMNRNAFARLSQLLSDTGLLKPNRNITVSAQLAMFLTILSHHDKNRIVGCYYKRSGRTVSKYFHQVLQAILKLHHLFLVVPTPVPDDEQSDRWKHFKGCLGALDGTYVEARVLKADKGRYRNRKGQTTVNVLAICDRNMNFIYILSGWEGSAADSRVLRDAIARPNGLRVPLGNFYLCDNGYTNGEGFLTPYRGYRYHKDDWGVGASVPQNKEEYFNFKHSKARNVIERSFALVKGRWAILRSPSYYPIKIHARIIMACFLLHNYIRIVMPYDPQEFEHNQFEESGGDDNEEFIETVESSNQWSNWRDELATTIYNEFMMN